MSQKWSEAMAPRETSAKKLFTHGPEQQELSKNYETKNDDLKK